MAMPVIRDTHPATAFPPFVLGSFTRGTGGSRPPHAYHLYNSLSIRSVSEDPALALALARTGTSLYPHTVPRSKMLYTCISWDS